MDGGDLRKTPLYEFLFPLIGVSITLYEPGATFGLVFLF